MKKNKLLISALCVGMAVAQMPMGVWAAADDPEEIIFETEPDEVLSEESGFFETSDDYYYDTVEADLSHPAFLDDYGFEELFPLTLEGVEPDGDPDVSHLYTLKAGETLEFTDSVSDEIAITYKEGDTLALCKGGTAVIKFKPASYDPSKTYNVYAVYNEGYDDIPGDVTDLGNGSYSMEVSYAAMLLNIHGVIDPSSYVPGEFAGGTGTASDPYQIATYDQLKLMGTQTKEGLYYKLISDITANTSEPDDNSPNVWTPIDPKGCHFDGAGHTIKNLCLGAETGTVTEYNTEVEKTCSALFGPQGTVEEIKNVTVNNVYFNGDAVRQASLAIKVKDMSNCKISGTITRSNDLADPSTFSLSTYKLPYFAGLAYSSTGQVSKCIYDAQFEAKVVTIVSGIVYSATNISECVTTDSAYLKHDADCIRGTTMMDFWMIPISGAVAGIANRVEPADGKTSVVKDNVNNATIDAQCSHDPHNAAGIVINASSTSGTIETSGNINNGNIKGLEVGGVAVSLNGKISDCKNTGKIEGYYSAAGIVRNIYKGAVVSNCVNEGNILVTDGSGSGIKDGFYGAAGLIGEANDVDLITNCTNSGKIESAAASSGMMGWVTYSKSSKVENCANLGDVSGSEAAGIIFNTYGYTDYDDKNQTQPGRLAFNNSYNSGTIKMSNTDGEHGWGFGGLIGIARYVDIENCFNAGLVDESLIVTAEGSNKTAAGIVGTMSDTTISKSYNIGLIKAGPDQSYAMAAKDKDNAGACTISECYYLDGSASNAAGSTDGKPVSGLTATKLYGSAMTTSESFANWDFDKVWQVGKNENYPYPEIISNNYAGSKIGMKESAGDLQIISGGIFVVNQKFDVTGTDFFGQTYAKYDAIPKGSAKVTKAGLVTVSKVPADGKITINGYVKEGSKFKKDKAYVFTVKKPVVTKTISFTMPYDKDINPDDTNASKLADSLISGADGLTYKWVSNKPAIADYDEESGKIIAKSKGTAKLSAVFGDPASPYSAKYPVTVKVSIPKINKTKADILSGATPLTLKINGAPKGSTVVWSVAEEDAEFVSVDAQKGKVTALKYKEGDEEGTDGIVTVKASIDGKEFACYTCEVTVKKPALAKTIPAMKVGKNAKITVKNTKYKAKEGGGITFESDNPEIATVDAKGSVKAVSSGECIIKVTVAGVELECPVKVN